MFQKFRIRSDSENLAPHKPSSPHADDPPQSFVSFTSSILTLLIPRFPHIPPLQKLKWWSVADSNR